MYLFGAFTVLLLYQRPLVLSAKALPEEDFVPRRAYPDQDIEDIIENLVPHANGKSQHRENPGDFVIDLSPDGLQRPREERQFQAEGTKTDQEEEEKKSDKRSSPLEGEVEYIGFVKPNPKPNLRLAEKSVVEVKRAPAGSSPFTVTAELGNTMFVATITACVVAAVFGLVVAGVVFRRIHKQHEAAREASYPQYGGTGPSIEKKSKQKSPTAGGDANLAYSAQLHHFNQTKQKIISTEASGCESRGQESEDSEGEGEEGDYSVYECPGLAPTGDIEVSNPLFENNSPKGKDAPESELSSQKQGATEGD